MPRYQLLVNEHISKTVEVIADNAAQAEQLYLDGEIEELDESIKDSDRIVCEVEELI